VTSEKSERAKSQALAGYLDPGPKHLNCAQAVVTAGLIMMDQELCLVNAANYFGGGLVRTGQACGAVTGAAMALGLRELQADESLSKNSAFNRLQQLIRDFEENFGAVACRDLIGCDITTPEGYREAKRSQATSRCPEFVSWVIDRLAELV
jgi:C_GCAxxG_C_C family probable redox protein